MSWPCLNTAVSITAVSVTISLVSNLSAIVGGLSLFRFTDNASVENRFNDVANGIWWGGTALTDILIAACMTYYLMRHDSVFHRTNSAIVKLTRMIIETGSMTAFIGLLTMVLFFAEFPSHIYYAAGVVILPKSYSISALMIINSRAKIVSGDMCATDIDISSHGMISSPRFAHSTVPTANETVITITREVFMNNGVLNDGVELKTMPVHEPGSASHEQ
ncbi:hypothetical protein FB45DRAFT_930301 [Roridomyces roridus]|uniref:DUF6534 domain-containing protein n=1 Tax=Roridomyces roridus TaxID=1738132 RepID=A0AAD7FGK5_9AGAR|nr:hypothetical protein FB45DRAFT_930301 [Roridomyces roridus]